MLLSMTGYGRATNTHDGQTITVEIRALNSKQSDLRLRSSQHLHRYELKLRKYVLAAAQRGKLDMNVDIQDEGSTGAVRVDLSLLAGLYDEVVWKLPDHARHGVDAAHQQGLIAGLLRIPGVIDAGSQELSETTWSHLLATTEDCLTNLRDYRSTEGTALEKDIASCVRAIKEMLEQVSQFEDQRIGSVRERMERHLTDYVGKGNVDKNRYEQEVLFYLEKMDINEEKVRLRQNCDYFLETLGNDDLIKGRKLNFIAQEVGREVNTLGAKAYSPDIQRLVVTMKENLEMIKEQLANVA